MSSGCALHDTRCVQMMHYLIIDYNIQLGIFTNSEKRLFIAKHILITILNLMNYNGMFVIIIYQHLMKM